MPGKFSDPNGARTILDGPLFGRGLFSLTHIEVGDNRIDYRQKDPYGIGSLQVVINPATGGFYADMDRFDAYDYPIGTIGHITAEVIAPRVSRFFINLFN